MNNNKFVENSLSPELSSGMPFEFLSLKIMEGVIKTKMEFLQDYEENASAMIFLLQNLCSNDLISNDFCYSTLVDNFVSMTSAQYESDSKQDDFMNLSLPLTLLESTEYRKVCGNRDSEIEEDFVNEISEILDIYVVNNMGPFLQQRLASTNIGTW